MRDFAAYLKGLVDDRRGNPRDPEKDLLTRLIRHEHEGRKLSEPELLQNCIFILNAGHETTTNLIGNTLDILIRFPAERRRLIENPALMKSAVEEALRYESSNQLGNRIVTEDVTLGGVAMPKGTLVTIGIGAANRDGEQFPDPDRFDSARNPTRHLAFGSGIHMCAGMSLARLEGRVAIERFLAPLPGLRAGRRGDAQPPRALSRLSGAAGRPALNLVAFVTNIAKQREEHDPEKWIPVFGKDHAHQ